MKKLLFNKESLFVALIFFMFFPIKTQFQNLIAIFLDAAVYQNQLLDIYNLNFTGNLIGCLEKVEFSELIEGRSYLFANLIWILGYVISFVLGLFFLKIKNKENFPYLKWILLVGFCFSVYDGLELIIGVIPYISFITSQDNIPYFVISLLFIILGCLVFLKLKKKDKLKILVISLPFCCLGGVMWYRFLGPILLPMVSK